MNGVPDAAVYQRATRVVWRLVGASVLTQTLDGDPHDAASELTGWAARVWVALDEPAGVDELCERLGCGWAEIEGAVRQLATIGLLREA